MQISQSNELVREVGNYKQKPKRSKLFFIMITLLSILIISLMVSICTGKYAIPVDELFRIIVGRIFELKKTWPDTVETVLFDVRLPRILIAVLIGAALSAAGSTYQGMFKNPMVSPDILGASAGAGFGAALGILFSMNSFEIELCAFAFGIAAVGISYFLGNIIGHRSNVTLVLVLTGIVVQNMFTAFISIIKYVADPESKLPAITFWLMGGLDTSTWNDILVIIIPIIVAIIPLFLIRYKINILSFGEEEAQAMGVNTKKIRLLTIICSTLLTTAAVSVSGMIGWVGLIIPHIARMLVGPNYKILLPTSIIIGGTYLLLIDDLARSLFSTEIPLGILTALIGAPFFLILLMRENRRAN